MTRHSTAASAGSGVAATSDTLGAPYLTATQVADLLQLSAKSIYRLARADATMPMLKIGGTVRFPRERLERWLREREQGRPQLRRQVLSVAKSAPDKEAKGA